MKSINELIALAEQRNPEAQFDLAYCYSRGDGVEQNDAEAIRWWGELANVVDPYNNECEYTDEEYEAFDEASYYIGGAQYELGYHYYNGISVEQSYEEAVKWFTLGAGNNSVHAMNDLAKCYYYGYGVKKSYTEALKWFKEAAAQWHPESQYYLGLFYSEGSVVRADVKIAANWLLLAARGFYFAGALNYKDTNMDKANEFYNQAVDAWKRAAKMGYAEAKYQLDHIRFYNELTEEELDNVTAEYVQRQFDVCESIPWKQTPFSIANDIAGIERKSIPEDVFVGDKIYHKSFGNGAVIEVQDNKIVVECEAVGKKTFVNPDAFIGGFLYKPYGAENE